MFFGGAFIVGGWRVVGWVGKSYLGPTEITIFSSWDFSRSKKHDTFWHVVSTRYFYVLFLWAISVSDFIPLEIYKDVGFSLSTITLTVNSHADKHFYKYIYLFQIYSMKSVFLLKYSFKFFTAHIFYSFSVDCKTYWLNYMLYTHDVICSLRRWSNRGKDIYKKDKSKLKYFEKIVFFK